MKISISRANIDFTTQLFDKTEGNTIDRFDLHRINFLSRTCIIKSEHLDMWSNIGIPRSPSAEISSINFISRILHNAVIRAHRRPGQALNHFLKYRINIHSDRYRRTPQVSPLRFCRSAQHVRIYTIMPINRLLSTRRLTQSILVTRNPIVLSCLGNFPL